MGRFLCLRVAILQLSFMVILNSVLLAAKKTFDFFGRAERLEHWAFSFFTASFALGGYVIHKSVITVFESPMNWIVLVVGLWLVIANISLMARRLHDHGHSGLFLFFPFVFLTIWVFAYDQFMRGDAAAIGQQAAYISMRVGLWGFLATCGAFLSFFARAGDSEENRYGSPT